MKYTIVFVAITLFSTSFADDGWTDVYDKWTPSPLCPYPSEDITRFPYEGDCTKWWECYEGARYIMTCAEGLEYNSETQKCENPSTANCDKWATITYPTFSHGGDSTVTPPSTADPLCPYPSTTVIYYPYPQNCSRYYECYNGVKYLLDCPAGYYWNVNNNYCDFLENVDCSQNNITLTPPPSTSPGTTTTTGPWTPDPICPYPSDTLVFYPNPANCSTYWECYQGNKYLMSCGQLFWNDLAKVCDYKDNVDCSSYSTVTAYTNTPTPTGPTIPTAPTVPPTGTGSTDPTATTPTTTEQPGYSCNNKPDGSFIPNINDCHKFYECVENKAIGQTCGDLYWNNEKGYCDYKDNVICITS